VSATVSPNSVGQVVSELTRLPEEDLSLVVEFVECLKQRRATLTQRLILAEIRPEERRQATLLRNVPREEEEVIERLWTAFDISTLRASLMCR
jgi:hypothetical protein